MNYIYLFISVVHQRFIHYIKFTSVNFYIYGNSTSSILRIECSTDVLNPCSKGHVISLHQSSKVTTQLLDETCYHCRTDSDQYIERNLYCGFPGSTNDSSCTPDSWVKREETDDSGGLPSKPKTEDKGHAPLRTHVNTRTHTRHRQNHSQEPPDLKESIVGNFLYVTNWGKNLLPSLLVSYVHVRNLPFLDSGPYRLSPHEWSDKVTTYSLCSLLILNVTPCLVDLSSPRCFLTSPRLGGEDLGFKTVNKIF